MVVSIWFNIFVFFIYNMRAYMLTIRDACRRPFATITIVMVANGRRHQTSNHENRGGGDSKVENLCTGFRCFVACMLPVGVGKNETNPSRKENGQHGQ